MELEAKVPLVYGSDHGLNHPLNLGAGHDQLFNSTGQGIGDVEATARYQFNDTSVNSRSYIGSLRFKSRTGKDPFEVLTDTTETLELITNRIKTLYTIQPGLSIPTDPAVFLRRIELSVQSLAQRGDGESTAGANSCR